MKKKIIIILIVLFLLALGFLTYYKFFMNKKEEATYSISDVKEEKKSVTGNVVDKDLYKDKIISDTVLKYAYDIISESGSIVGNINIDSNGYLYIFNSKDDSFYKVSDIKFKTLYRIGDNTSFLDLYAISEDGYLYYIFLNSLDIKAIQISKIETANKVQNFVNIEFKSILGMSISNIFVLEEDNNIYEARTGIRYDSSIISLNEEYYIFGDNTIANSYGNMLKDSDNNYYKIKYYIVCNNSSDFEESDAIIITTDNKLIFSKQNSISIYVYSKEVKSVKYDESNDINNRNITITFKDNSTKKFVGTFYSEYYGLD